MKLTVTREQIRAALEKMFKTEIEDFSIIPSRPSATGLLCRKAVIQPGSGETKVANIKRLRTVGVGLKQPMTLMEAKHAVENWDQWIGFVDEYNRLPLRGYGSGEGKGILK